MTHDRPTSRVRGLALLSGLAALALGGCSGMNASDREILSAMNAGEFGQARSISLTTSSEDVEDRRYLLDRQRILWASLAEGDMATTAAIADYTYDQLREQGVNAGKEFGQFVLGDQAVRVWKGEPFEQAAAFTAIAVSDGVLGEWGNMRASAKSSAFQLRDLNEVVEGERQVNPNELDSSREYAVAAAQRHDNDRAAKPGDGGDQPTERFSDTIPLVASDFAPGYALAALAERELGERAQMEESLRQLIAVRPTLDELADLIRDERNTLAIVVDYGAGPEKIRTGPDGAIADFQSRTESDDGRLEVRVDSGTWQSFPLLTDYNVLAKDLKWNNFEDVRVAKSVVGSALVLGGATTAAISNDTTTQLVGAGVAVVGLILKSTSGADTRQCVTLPQRTYLALMPSPGAASIDIRIEGHAHTEVRIPGIQASGGAGELRMHYVRLPSQPVTWAQAQGTLFANDHTGPISEQPDLPWILGGTCVRTPSQALAEEYRAAGMPSWISEGDLIRMYEDEGIAIDGMTQGVPTGVHIFEGGNSLYTPAPGSAGFARLFCMPHPAYSPRGETARAILAEMSSGTALTN